VLMIYVKITDRWMNKSNWMSQCVQPSTWCCVRSWIILHIPGFFASKGSIKDHQKILNSYMHNQLHSHWSL
jgi:hypothetical protein